MKTKTERVQFTGESVTYTWDDGEAEKCAVVTVKRHILQNGSAEGLQVLVNGVVVAEVP